MSKERRGIKYDGSNIIFNRTGRKESVCAGIVGLGIDDNHDWHLRLFEGRDGTLAEGYDETYEYRCTLSQEEKEDLADFMISQWKQFKIDG